MTILLLLTAGAPAAGPDDTHTDPTHQVRIVGAWDPVESKFLAVKARDLGQETTLHNVIVDGPDADGPDGEYGHNAYGVFVVDCSGIHLQDCTINAGSGRSCC